ncbi:MAG: hypothetical protein RLZZ05_1460, partial [Bacteroidota bacterium]
MSRRQMLDSCKCGFGSLAMVSLFGSLLPSCSGASNQQNAHIDALLSGAKLPGFLPKAKNIIFLYMDGGVSQVDSFDPKPRLEKENGEDPNNKFKVDDTQFGNV